ncbi:hypothetical protein TCAL_01926 [Tigriopus californicus]|uniref:SH3 domain-containing protein n=1 Tax=Tigriopus californicus TaxID=6832 RepID=A0A553P818_TIGCA|nr:hypothetical protein TCAL_01926 [Tigriopus californicus]
MRTCWGTELWDKYQDLTSHTQRGIDFLESSVGSFIKERGKIEDQYAKSLRGLVKKFSIKDNPKPDEEFTYIKAYKKMLTEVGFEAGQHERLAEAYTQVCYKGVHDNVKKLKERKKRNTKDHDKICTELEQSFKAMDSSRSKFRKAFDEQEKAFAAIDRAEKDGGSTKNDISKLKKASNDKSRLCENAKGDYARQLVKTNDTQHKHYLERLPSLINDLQVLDQDRIEFIRSAILTKMSKRSEIEPIIKNCQDSIVSAIKEINPEDDTEIVIERYKSGDVPPNDFKFEDMSDPQSMLLSDPREKATNLNLYPRKKEIERAIEEAEHEHNKKTKEFKSLQQMVNTYKENPKFGSTKKFQSEIHTLEKDVAQLERHLDELRKELKSTESRLESIRSRSPMVGSPMLRGSLNRTPRSSQSSGSIKSSSLSLSSAAPMNTSPDPISSYEEINNSNNYQNDHWDQDEFGDPSVPSVMPTFNGSTSGLSRCVAIYNYDSSTHDFQETNLPMTEGEEFEVIEPDSNGWTGVRRLGDSVHGGIEGFVPTSFLRLI